MPESIGLVATLARIAVVAGWVVLLYNLPQFWRWYGELLNPVVVMVSDWFGALVIKASQIMMQCSFRGYAFGFKILVKNNGIEGVEYDN